MKFLAYIVFFLSMIVTAQDSTALHNYLKNHFKQVESFTYSIASQPALLKAPGATYTIETDKAMRSNGSYAYVPIIVKNANGTTLKSLLTLRVTVSKKVFRALGVINSGEEVTNAQVEEVVENISDVRGDPVESLSSKGLVAAIKIPAGAILTKTMVEVKPDVLAGETVSAYVAQGSVVVTLSAVARESGSVGDIIRVVTGDNKLLRGKIENENIVRIIN